jgi:hypothetical protein
MFQGAATAGDHNFARRRIVLPRTWQQWSLGMCIYGMQVVAGAPQVVASIASCLGPCATCRRWCWPIFGAQQVDCHA